MGLLSAFKAQKAMSLQRKGKTAEAMALYEEAFKDGATDARCVLAYAILLIRDGQYEKAKDLLVKYQKMPGMTAESRVELITDYSVCVHKLGQPEKAIQKMEELFRKNPTGLIYQTLGYLYVEKYDLKNRPDESERFPEPEQVEEAVVAEENAAEAPAEQENPVPAPVAEEASEEETPVEKVPATPLEAYEMGREKAMAFCTAAVEYDEEDAVSLDNMAQMLYRCYGNKEAAKEWFLKALAQKENQIDTLWFLSRYDLEQGNKAAALEKLETAADGRFSPLNFVTRQIVQDEIARLKA